MRVADDLGLAHVAPQVSAAITTIATWVTLPTGHRRIILFRAGTPASFDALVDRAEHSPSTARGR